MENIEILKLKSRNEEINIAEYCRGEMILKDKETNYGQSRNISTEK